MTPEERFAADNQRLHKMLYPETAVHWISAAVVYAALIVAIRFSVILGLVIVAAWVVTGRIWYRYHR